MTKEKMCSGFPEGPGKCRDKSVATVAGLRVAVCEMHGKQAEEKGHHLVRAKEKS